MRSVDVLMDEYSDFHIGSFKFQTLVSCLSPCIFFQLPKFNNNFDKIIGSL